MEAIETTNEASNSTTEPIIIPVQQLAAIKSTSKEVRNGILLSKLFRPTFRKITNFYSMDRSVKKWLSGPVLKNLNLLGLFFC